MWKSLAKMCPLVAYHENRHAINTLNGTTTAASTRAKAKTLTLYVCEFRLENIAMHIHTHIL